MATRLEIFNHAMAILGETGLVDADSDTTNGAVTLRAVYGLHRDSLLQLARWNFARSRRRLPRLARPPDFGWRNQYLLPADWVAIQPERLMVPDGPRITRYEIEIPPDQTRRAILCDAEDAIHAIGVRRVPESAMPALFAAALGAYLAWQTGRRIIGNDTRRLEDAERIYRDTLSQARQRNVVERPPRLIEADPAAAARFGASGLDDLRAGLREWEVSA